MVYRGRPSTGCKKCRERKIKCDEQPDGCLKCGERGITCPGYDRTIDAFFHDETLNVQVKAKKSKAKAIAAREARYARDPALGIARRHGCPKTCISAPIVDRAINFFITYHTLGLEQPPITSQAYHQHLSTNGFHPLVAATMTAMGIAGLANLYMDSGLKFEATRWYLNAIKLANVAISSPEEARSDTTLVAVNLLSMFEAMSNDKSLSGWSNHVEGAAALVKLRGVSQFASPAGRRMYLHTIGMLTMNCMGQGIAVPDFVQDLNKEIEQYMDIDDPRHAFFFLHIKANDLRAQIIDQPYIDLHNVIDRSLELDEIAISIFERAGSAWDYEVVPCSGNESGVFGDYYHVYPAHATAQTWNWIRYNRIYFHDIIRNCILCGFATSPPVLVVKDYVGLLERSTQLLYELQSDILASMPQFLHDTPNIAPSTETFDDCIRTRHASARSRGTSPSTPPLSTPTETLISTSPENTPKDVTSNFRLRTIGFCEQFVGDGLITDRLPILRVSNGYSTLWALYVAGSMPTASPSSQEFVLRCLDRVEHDCGVKLASVLAKALRIKRQVENCEGSLDRICPQYLPPDTAPYTSTPERE